MIPDIFAEETGWMLLSFPDYSDANLSKKVIKLELKTKLILKMTENIYFNFLLKFWVLKRNCVINFLWKIFCDESEFKMSSIFNTDNDLKLSIWYFIMQ